MKQNRMPPTLSGPVAINNSHAADISAFNQLIHSLNVPVYLTDAEGTITSFNREASALWGREPQIGKDKWCGWLRITSSEGDEIPIEECPMARAIKTQTPVKNEEINIHREDGRVIIVQVHPHPLFDSAGKLIGGVNVLIDVTSVRTSARSLNESQEKLRSLASSLEQEVAEQTHELTVKNEELAKSEERYHKMVEEVEDYAIILLDERGIIRNWNRGAEKIKGYKEQEILGKHFEVFYPQEDRDRGLVGILLNEARVNGKAVHEGWRVRKDGTRFWGSIVITALHDRDNNIIGFSKVTRDLTERKLAEDKIKEYSTELEFQNKELEQFAYAASHDLKEPLRKILFYNSYIQDNCGDILDERSREYLTRSLQAAHRMTNLIEDLLNYSRTNYNIEKFEKTDLNTVVDDIVKSLTEELEQKHIAIKRDLLPNINVVPFQFKQLLENLINNSIKYKHPDRNAEITITSDVVMGAETTEKEAEPGTLYNRISVIDNGIGFEQQFSQKIFDIFQRLHNSNGAKGSGIGLAICKKIAQQHRGFITATGSVNIGARFDVYIPDNF